MAEIIRLHSSPHEQTQALLPWYTTGTLDPQDMELVESHLAGCAGCRAELEFERVLGSEVAGLPMDMEHGWADMAARLDAPPPRPPLAFLKQRVAFGWALAGQAGIAAAALFLGVLIAPTPEPAAQTYHALGAQPASAVRAGNILIIFVADTSEGEMRAALLQTGSRVVDGPNTSGAYVIEVDPTSREQIVKQLQGLPQVALAEPVDAGG